MACSSSRDQDPDDTDAPKKASDMENPFITFRRFADEQVNSILDSVFAIPTSILAELVDHDRRAAERRKHDGTTQPRLQSLGNAKEETPGPLERMFRDLERSVEEERKDQESMATQAETDIGNGCTRNRDSREPKVWQRTWSWSWPPKHENEPQNEQKQPLNAREEDIRAEMRLVQKHIESFFHQPWQQHPDVPEEDMYDKWETFLLHDRYSPLQLEKAAHLAHAGVDWRLAYEDLLSKTVQTATGLPNDHEYYSNNHNDRYLSPTQWIRHLHRRHDALISNGSPFNARMYPFIDYSHLLPPTKRFSTRTALNREQTDQDNSSHHSWNSAQSESEAVSTQHHSDDGAEEDHFESDSKQHSSSSHEQTELDMYNHFLNWSGAPHHQSKTADSKTGPSVLSTLTTTKRTIHPDGSVTTKIVLKKRFADGREENSETVHTAHGGVGDGADKDKQRKKGKGWFWSE